MPDASRPALALLLAAALATPPLAAQAAEQTETPSQPAPRPSTSSLRAYTLRNMSGKVITTAHAFMDNNKTDLVTSQRKIEPNQSQNFGTNQKGCLDTVSVTFKDGQTLQSGHIGCHSQTVVVRNDKITADSSAVPGASPPSNPSDK